jgi:hypothetical protein
MLARQKQQVQAYQRVQDFLGAHPPPQSAPYTVQKQVLDDVVAKLTEHGTDQGAARRMNKASAQKQAVLRASLRSEHLAPLAQIARAMLRHVPGISAALRMPSWKLKTHNLVRAAGEFRKVAAGYEAVFVEAGRPQDFLAQLDAVVAALGDSGRGQARNVGARVGATRGIEAELKRGRTAIELIDTMVRSAFARDAVTLGAWSVARRISGIPGGGGAPTPEVAGTPTDPKAAA